MANKCGNCRHWQPYGQRHDPVYGACGVRAYVATTDNRGNENQILRSVFRDASCGEHESLRSGNTTEGRASDG